MGGQADLSYLPIRGVFGPKMATFTRLINKTCMRQALLRIPKSHAHVRQAALLRTSAAVLGGGHHPVAANPKGKDYNVLDNPFPDIEHTQTKEEYATEHCPETEDNWISYGFSYVDKTYDRFSYHLSFFLFLTFGTIGVGFVLAYQPDHRLVSWANREAYLELARREQLGLPLVDPDYVPRDKIVLPPDEVLDEFEIVI